MVLVCQYSAKKSYHHILLWQIASELDHLCLKPAHCRNAELAFMRRLSSVQPPCHQQVAQMQALVRAQEATGSSTRTWTVRRMNMLKRQRPARMQTGRPWLLCIWAHTQPSWRLQTLSQQRLASLNAESLSGPCPSASIQLIRAVHWHGQRRLNSMQAERLIRAVHWHRQRRLHSMQAGRLLSRPCQRAGPKPASGPGSSTQATSTSRRSWARPPGSQQRPQKGRQSLLS